MFYLVEKLQGKREVKLFFSQYFCSDLMTRINSTTPGKSVKLPRGRVRRLELESYAKVRRLAATEFSFHV